MGEAVEVRHPEVRLVLDVFGVISRNEVGAVGGQAHPAVVLAHLLECGLGGLGADLVAGPGIDSDVHLRPHEEHWNVVAGCLSTDLTRHTHDAHIDVRRAHTRTRTCSWYPVVDGARAVAHGDDLAIPVPQSGLHAVLQLVVLVAAAA